MPTGEGLQRNQIQVAPNPHFVSHDNQDSLQTRKKARLFQSLRNVAGTLYPVSHRCCRRIRQSRVPGHNGNGVGFPEAEGMPYGS